MWRSSARRRWSFQGANDIENHSQPGRVCAIDEPAQVVGCPVQSRGCERMHAVVTPPELAREFAHGHHFEHCDPGVAQEVEFLGRGGVRPLRRERADMHFVDHLTVRFHSWPRIVGPAECCRVDHLGRFVRPIRLGSRRWIGVCVTSVDAVSIACAGLRLADQPRKMARLFACERRGHRWIAKNHFDLRVFGSPDSKMDPAWHNFSPCRQPPVNVVHH